MCVEQSNLIQIKRMFAVLRSQMAGEVRDELHNMFPKLQRLTASTEDEKLHWIHHIEVVTKIVKENEDAIVEISKGIAEKICKKDHREFHENDMMWTAFTLVHYWNAELLHYGRGKSVESDFFDFEKKITQKHQQPSDMADDLNRNKRKRNH